MRLFYNNLLFGDRDGDEEDQDEKDDTDYHEPRTHSKIRLKTVP